MSFSGRFRVKPGSRVDFKRRKTDDVHGVSRAEARRDLSERLARLATLQERMYAQSKWSVLVILQAMDAAGKDSTIEHVMSGIDPIGLRVTSFGVPSREELAHDYLWRTVKALPPRGHIGVHNRSHYEEVIVTKVHPEILASQRLPDGSRGERLYRRRYQQIRAFERHLGDNGTLVVKCFLHLSKREQARRLLARMEDPDKHWKVRLGDLDERRHWEAYMSAYAAAIEATSTKDAPWFIVPADHKWFTWLAVASILEEAFARINPRYPAVPESAGADWGRARTILKNELRETRKAKGRVAGRETSETG
jgi:PPK2 family polyphosphate:nucleotide phosphotransferase